MCIPLNNAGKSACDRKIIFSDEAHFDLGGFVNKQNYRIWGTECIEKPTHPKRVTVWSRCIIGQLFLENHQGEAVTVNGDRYSAMKMPILAKKIIFSDEDHFNLGGYVNNQNCRIWAQKTRTHTLRSRRIQNDSLFGVDFGPEA